MKKIFYSWQSDIKGNRNFLEECIQKAVEIVGNFRIDAATRDALGSPNINEDILKRIDSADIFLGDISIINPNLDGKKCPNPNVLFELGYALKALGESKLILIANALTTMNISDLPFDLRNRRILVKKFEKDTKESLIKETSDILRLYANDRVIESPYVYFTLESTSSNGDIKLKIYNNDQKPYFLEGIDFLNTHIALDEDLPPQSNNKIVTFTLPNYPFEIFFEEFSFTITHHGTRYRIFQNVKLESRADQKFNLLKVEKKPSKALVI